MEDKNIGSKMELQWISWRGYKEVLWGRNRDEEYFVKS